MSKLTELSQERADLQDGISALYEKAEAEDRELTADEQTACETAATKVSALDEQIDKLRRAGHSPEPLSSTVPEAQRKTSVPQSQLAWGQPGGHSMYGNQAHVMSLPRTRLRAFDSTPQGREAAYKSGMWVRAMVGHDPRAIDWCADRIPGFDIRAALSTSSATAGGAIVPDELAAVIISLIEQYGVFRANSRVVPMGSDQLSIPRRTGGVTANFVGENTEISDSDKSWDNITLTARKLAVLTRVSSELQEDAVISVVDDLARECAQAFAETEDDCGWNGDGTSTYGNINGLVTQFEADNTLAGYIQAASGIDTFAEVTTTELTRMMGALPEYASANAAWYVSRLGYAQCLLRIAAGAGGNTTGTLAGAMRREFLGSPVVISQKLPAVATALNAKVMLFYGDLSLASTFGSRRDIRIMADSSRYLEYDQVAVRATERFDIVNHDIGDADTAGPIVALIGQS